MRILHQQQIKINELEQENEVLKKENKILKKALELACELMEKEVRDEEDELFNDAVKNDFEFFIKQAKESEK